MNIDFTIQGGDTLPAIYTSLTDATGAPIDLTSALSVTFSMALEGSDTLTVSDPADVIGTAAQGNVQYAWSAGDTDTPGSYLACFTVTYPYGSQSFPSNGFIRVLVQPSLTDAPLSTAPSFVTTADVKTITGRDVTAADLSLAWSILEGVIGRPAYELLATDPGNAMTDRDKYWLSKAASFQAVWIVEHPDTFNSLDVVNINQSGQSATLARDALIVSPVARSHLRWVGWLKTRSVRIQRPRRYGLGQNWQNGAGDTQGPAWTGLR